MAKTKSKKEGRDHELRVASSDKELEAYRIAAEKVGTTVASWVRITLRRAVGLDQ